jgi:RHS repeat-associated protein
VRTFTFDTRNRLRSATGGGQPDLTNTWSGRGTLETTTVGGSTTTYLNDAFDHPVTAQLPGTTVTYTYDALGRLAQRNGVALGYADLTNNPVRAPVSGGESLISRSPDGTPLSDKVGGNAARLLAADGVHGDVVAELAADTGAVSVSAGYAPYGELTASTGPLPLGFQGGWTDPSTQLVNAHARWYSPALASFTGRDPANLDPDPLPQANRYAYGNGSPETLADPNGNCPMCLAAPLAAAGPPGWLVIGGLAVVGVVAFGISCKVQGGCHMPHFGGDGGSSATAAAPAAAAPAAVSPWDTPDGQRVRALANAANPAIQAAIHALVTAGAKPADIVDQIRAQFRTDPEVLQLTAASGVAAAAAAARPAAQTAAPSISMPRVGPPPPLEQTVINVRPPDIALLPAGKALENVVVGAPALVPSLTMLANSDGSDALTAAAAGVAGVVAAVAGTDDPKGDDDCEPDPRKLIEDTAQEVADQGLDVLDALLSPSQWAAVAEEGNGWRIWQYRGSEVHKETARRLQTNHPDRFVYRGVGPDFLDTLTGKLIELTTPGSKAAHKAKGGDYETCEYSLYKWKK